MRLFSVAILLAFFAGSIAGAKTIDLDGEQASIDLPDAWATKAQTADAASTTTTIILSAISAEKTSMLQVLVCTNPHGVMATQPELISNIKDNISNQALSHGGQVQFTDENTVSVNDVPAYLIQYSVTGAATPKMTARNYQLAANGKLYILTLRTVDAASDADLQAIANSFRFSSPPVLPTPQVTAHRIRYYLMAGAAVLVLAGIGVGLYYYRQRQLYE